MRILIADDSRTLRAALGDQLRAMGHEVTEAHEGLQAIDLFRVHEPDLIVPWPSAEISPACTSG